jgi:hypothetical protein
LFGVLVGIPIALFGLAKFGPAPIQERLFGRVGGLVGDWTDDQVEGFVELCTLMHEWADEPMDCECVANRLQATISSEELIEAFVTDPTPSWWDAALDNAYEACA